MAKTSRQALISNRGLAAFTLWLTVVSGFTKIGFQSKSSEEQWRQSEWEVRWVSAYVRRDSPSLSEQTLRHFYTTDRNIKLLVARIVNECTIWPEFVFGIEWPPVGTEQACGHGVLRGHRESLSLWRLSLSTINWRLTLHYCIRRSDDKDDVVALEEVPELIYHSLDEILQMRSHLFEHNHIVELEGQESRPPANG